MTRLRAAQPRTADLIHRELFNDIVAMRRKPNDPLPERDLLAHFGVSRTPLREALLRLADEGLVIIYPQVGTFVARIPVQALCESIMIRRALELVMIEEAVPRIDGNFMAALDGNLLSMEAAGTADDLDAFDQLDGEFHRIIAEVSGRHTIMAMIDAVRAQIDRYRLTTLPQAGRLDRVIEEHRAIRDGLAARDVAAATSSMNLHIGQMLTEVQRLDTTNPDFFLDDRKETS
ncbi:GntR family transcriptional regulator [Falsirhodobacter deserti]|uniref:GntR family transcriptional regulator n=1 Tax=Falsirhodobacter deserti TaxID=1365611 RepID=UPI000FE43B17|nr:GntR family transcriptional regulator [Falsirhodobacter deserti]